MAKKMLLYARFPFHLRTVKKISGAQRLFRWMDFAYEGCSGLIRPFQIKAEIFQLLKSLEKQTPKVVLEIGTAIGGNLFLFCRMAADDACIISIDLPGGCYGEGYPLWRAPLYKMFPAKNQKLHLIRADSHHAATLQKVARILNGLKIDFLFIDGDHTYEGVKQDFEMYQPLVKKGGIIALHDVVPHPAHTQCGVDRFWHEIKPRYAGKEIVNDCNQQWAGIGVIRNEIFPEASGCRAPGKGGCAQ